MKIFRLRPEELSAVWIDRLNRSSLMASVPFAELWRTMDGKPVYWAAEHEGEVVGVLPGIEYGVGPLTRFQAMPDGLYAHLVCADESIRELAAEDIWKELARASYAKMYVTDYFGDFGEPVPAEIQECSTIVVDISADWEPPDPKLRSEIRKAEREGVKVQRFNATKHMPGFLQIMKTTEERHGRAPKYPAAFFAELAGLAERDDRVNWLFVQHDGHPAASHIYFRERDTVLNWQIYFDKEFSFLKANQYLLYSVARESAATGFTKLNLGATPDDAEGVKVYKEKWGGHTYHYRRLVARSLLGRLR